MSEIKVNSIKGVGASAAAVTVHNSDGTCTLASGSKLNNCTTDGTTNFTIADGNLVVGTAGHGIDFSATPDGGGSTPDELLDDFEKGTFTPLISDSISSGTANSYLNQSGHYTKIGNIIHFIGAIRADDISNLSSSANVKIRGLPFAASDVTTGSGEPDVLHVSFINNLTNVSRGHVYGRIENGVSAAQLGYAHTTGQSAGNLTLSQINNSSSPSYIAFSGTYRTGG